MFSYSDFKHLSEQEKIKKLIIQNDVDTIKKYPKEKLIRTTHDNSSFLIFAVKKGKIDVVSYLLSVINVNDSDCLGMTPLHFACQSGKTRIVKLLIKNGANTTQVNISRETPLHIAARLKRIKICKILTNASNLNAKDANGKTPLHYAVENKCIKIAGILIGGGCDIEVKDKTLNTPLTIAIKKRYFKMASFLVLSGADVSDGTSLFLAVDGIPILINDILDSGANIEVKSRRRESTPLHRAAKIGSMSVVTTLIERGANLDACDNKGNTALFKAIKACRYDVANVLIKYGASLTTTNVDGDTIVDCILDFDYIDLKALIACKFDINLKNKHGQTLLHMATIQQASECATLLLQNGADLNSVDNNGCTPLSIAVQYQYLDLIALFLANGANPNYRNNNKDNTLLITAVLTKNFDSVKLLLEYNAKVDLTDKNGKSALHHACFTSNTNIAYLLLSYQASPFIYDHSGLTPIDAAISTKNPAIFKIFGAE